MTLNFSVLDFFLLSLFKEKSTSFFKLPYDLIKKEFTLIYHVEYVVASAGALTLMSKKKNTVQIVKIINIEDNFLAPFT